MNINVKVIQHSEQRYPTCGDWWIDDIGNLQVRVSYMDNKYYEWFVAAHEIDEAMLCIKHGVQEKDITAFDTAFEALRKQHPDLIGDEEPGNMSSAPYNQEHLIATQMEVDRVDNFDESWEDYENKVNSLP